MTSVPNEKQQAKFFHVADVLHYLINGNSHVFNMAKDNLYYRKDLGLDILPSQVYAPLKTETADT